MPPRPLLLMFLCLALIVRGRAMLAMVDSLDKDPDGYREVARCIDQAHTIGMWRQPFDMMTPTASRPPLYPLLLSVIRHFHLPWEAASSLYGLLHVVLGVASVWAVWRLGQLWGLPPGGSLLAAALITVDPILLHQSAQVMTETLATLLALLALLAMTHCARESSLRWSVAAGALLGLCVLCRPTFLVWLVSVVAVMLPLRSAGTRRLVRIGAILGAAAAVLAPWAVRNQIVFGRPVITTTHGGFTLLLANNPQFYEYLRSAPWGSTWDAEGFYRWWDSQQHLIETPSGLAADELDADREAYELAWQNIRNEPAMFAYACLVRVGRLWGILPHQVNPAESTSRRGMRFAVAIWYATELALAAAGLWALGRNLLRAPWIWGSLLLMSFTAVHAFYWTDLRMRAPLMGVVALLAAQGVVVLASGNRVAKPLVVET